MARGKAETVTPLPEFFSLEQPRLKVFRRIGAPVAMPTDRLYGAVPLSRPMPPRGRQSETVDGVSTTAGNSSIRDSSSSLQAARLLDRLATGTATVDYTYHVRTIYISGRRLLGIRTAAIGEDLIHRVSPTLAGPLREAIDAALRGEPTTALHHCQLTSRTKPSGIR